MKKITFFYIVFISFFITVLFTIPETNAEIIIDTYSSWEGAVWSYQIGEDPWMKSTYGQTFSPPGENLVLNTFSIWLSDSPIFDPDPLVFAGYLMEWDGQRSVGRILYQSQPMNTASQEHGEMREYQFDIGIPLEMNSNYVFFVSVYDFFDGIPSGAFVGAPSGDAYPHGTVVWLDNSQECDPVMNCDWNWPLYEPYIGHDLVFRANFTAYNPNFPPIADAGLDQPVAVDSTCIASITLDGSGSYDPDGDPLTYTWTWDGGAATGINPTIQLPLGTITITLVVNDGILDSEPDTVDINSIDETPPEISLAASPDILWPPNHKMILITPIITVNDNCDYDPIVELTSVTTNEGAINDKGWTPLPAKM